MNNGQPGHNVCVSVLGLKAGSPPPRTAEKGDCHHGSESSHVYQRVAAVGPQGCALRPAAERGDVREQRGGRLKVAVQAASHLGRAVAGMMNLMNPSLVIVGGELSQLGDLLLEPLRETVNRRTLVSSVTAAEIVVSELGPRSVAVGAATLVLKAALNDSGYFPAVAAVRNTSDIGPE